MKKSDKDECNFHENFRDFYTEYMEERKKQKTRLVANKHMRKLSNTLLNTTTCKFGSIINTGQKVSENEMSLLPEHLKNVYSGIIIDKGEEV